MPEKTVKKNEEQSESTAMVPGDGLEQTVFTAESAIALIRKQEAKVKEAARKLPPKPENTLELSTTSRIEVGLWTSTAGVLLGSVTGNILVDVPAWDIATYATAISGMGALVAMSIIDSFDGQKKVFSKIFPKKYEKIALSHEPEVRLWELKEKEYKKAEKKAIKKAQPALDYFNSQLTGKKARMVFDKNHNGLVIEEEFTDSYDKLLLETAPALKELESPLKNKPLSITQKESVDA